MDKTMTWLPPLLCVRADLVLVDGTAVCSTSREMDKTMTWLPPLLCFRADLVLVDGMCSTSREMDKTMTRRRRK
jgi:hypothetical protein